MPAQEMSPGGIQGELRGGRKVDTREQRDISERERSRDPLVVFELLIYQDQPGSQHLTRLLYHFRVLLHPRGKEGAGVKEAACGLQKDPEFTAALPRPH